MSIESTNSVYDEMEDMELSADGKYTKDIHVQII